MLWLKQSISIPQIKPECHLNFNEIDLDLYYELRKLEPFGIGNPEPVFWTRGCRILEMKINRGGHLNLKLSQSNSIMQAIAWRVSEIKLPDEIDIAYKVKLNTWNDNLRIQLELVSTKIYSSSFKLKYQGNQYNVSLNNSDEIMITNSKGKVITGTFNHFDNIEIIGPLNENDYVQGLFDQASIALACKH